MARPPKDPQLRMDSKLLMPLTADQKAAIKQAAKVAGKDMTAWAREILLKAAKRQA